MREILFRGKRADNGEWAYGLYVLFGGKSIIMLSDTTELRPSEIFGLNDLYENPVIHEVDPDTVSQFTGLLDKNGAYIFEGDIVRCLMPPPGFDGGEDVWHYAVTEYGEFNCSCCNGVYGWTFKGDHDFCDIRCCDTPDSETTYFNEKGYCYIYVCGNKWDNPELLNP